MLSLRGIIMKKFILAMALTMFSFTAQAETVCIDVAASMATMTESEILSSLTGTSCSMSLEDAVAAILAAGGDQTRTLAAAMIINPDFTYTDPTLGLNPTAAGGDTPLLGTGKKFASNTPVSGGGGGPVSP